MRPTILMFEHDEDDRYITQTFFDENKFRVNLQFVTNREDFQRSLKDLTSKSEGPSLILLNYHTGPVTAVELLQEIKSDSRFKHIPVVVLSGTVRPEIIKDCYHAGASSFIQKPSTAKGIHDKISSFVRYWFETVELA